MRGHVPKVKILLSLAVVVALALPAATAAAPRAPSTGDSEVAASPAGWLAPLLDLWRSWWSPQPHPAAGSTTTGGSGEGGDDLTSPTDPPTEPECDPSRQEGPCVDPNG